VANVTAVALEFGFTHLGRFAELYRQTFGILPSTSLKARQDNHKGS
jgi:AraC-like DNA-binding protein